MARDDTAREHDTEVPLLDQRTHLGLADAATAPPAATTAGASSIDAPQVPAGAKSRTGVVDGPNGSDGPGGDGVRIGGGCDVS